MHRADGRHIIVAIQNAAATLLVLANVCYGASFVPTPASLPNRLLGPACSRSSRCSCWAGLATCPKRCCCSCSACVMSELQLIFAWSTKTRTCLYLYVALLLDFPSDSRRTQIVNILRDQWHRCAVLSSSMRIISADASKAQWLLQQAASDLCLQVGME